MKSGKAPIRFRRRSTRGHVRRTKQSLPTWLVGLVGVIGLIAVILLVRQLFAGGDEEEAIRYHNRTWLHQEWTVNEPNREQVEALVERLNDNRIDVIYVQTGEWRLDGSYREFEHAADFRQLLKSVDADIKALVWVWVDNNLYTDTDRHAALSAYAQTAMRQWGYDGIHLQGFSVFDGSENYVRLVRRLDAVTSANNGILSITAPPDRRPADADVPVGEGNAATSWSPRYKQQLGLIVDEMVIMGQASGLSDIDDYETWLAYQIETYAKDIERVNSDVDLIITIPTYAADDFHDPIVENVETANNGAVMGLEQAGSSRRMVRGAGMFHYRDATNRDWLEFAEMWAD